MNGATEYRKVTAVCYSATGNTIKVVSAVAEAVAEALDVPVKTVDYGCASVRSRELSFGKDEVLVIGVPTYRGKLPMYIFDRMADMIRGDGTPAVAVVTYGNRSFDNSLAELIHNLRLGGFSVAAAAAFPCRHAYTDLLAPGRPNDDDLAHAGSFGRKAVETVLGGIRGKVEVPGIAGAPYYIPKGADGKPVSFTEVKPETDVSKCNRCGKCVELCPLDSIDPGDPTVIKGHCFKCQACVRGCPEHAKKFTDPQFVSHLRQLENECRGRKEIETFFPGE